MENTVNDSSITEVSSFEVSYNFQNSETLDVTEHECSIEERSVFVQSSEQTLENSVGSFNGRNFQESDLETSSICENSTEELSLIQDNVERRHIHILSPIAERFPAVYDFIDDEPPPPVRAPVLCEEDLFERNSDSNSTDNLSIISSTLPTSGSSTQSEPFGHLEYEHPNFKTSTPVSKGRRDKTNTTTMIMKKACSLALKKATKKCGCERKCTSKKFYERKVIKKLRTLYWTLDTEEREQWFSGKFEDFQPSSESTCNQRFTFRINGNVVCQQAWLQGHGITKSSFYRYRTKWQNSNLTRNSKAGQSFSEQKQAAIHWLGEYIAQRGERPPHQQEVWLPFGMRKKEIYIAYRNEQIMDFNNFMSTTSFYAIWRKFYSHVKIRSTNLFTKCTTCVKLDRALQLQLNPQKRQAIFREKQAHLHRIIMEKLAYYRRRTISRRRPDRYLSLIIDGMDNTKTSLPHFKDRKGKDLASTIPMKTHVTGAINHGTHQKFVFTDIYQYKHDSNLTLNILMKLLWEASKGRPLPPVLYLQADNCFRENKNRFILSFLELLVHRRVFYEIQLSFLYVGHTHEDIDQMFSVFADRLRHTDATTLPELHQHVYNAQELNGCYNVSGWLDPCIAGVKSHSKSNIFRYRYDEANKLVNVYYRKNSEQPWKTLRRGFFKVRPNGLPLLPNSNPPVLMASFHLLDMDVLKKGNSIWSTYLTQEARLWWTNKLSFIQNMQSNKYQLTQYSRKGCIWRLNSFKPYDKNALEDSVDGTDPVPSDVRQLLAGEQETPEIIVNN
ncbi:Hypothetical predicted protein [Mytilus galloprovincialis]|uniref:DUF7869 domain-containing protein n=3 Tax=Mytilus TaxID=6548 RepID=A0A8B6EA14_MYTGA|nr:Hypothetical predicted protein [Mytilus galloprovincialis]